MSHPVVLQVKQAIPLDTDSLQTILCLMNGTFFTGVTNKNVALVTSEITWNKVFWLDNANMQKGEMESLFPPLALSEVSTVKSRGLCHTQCPLPAYLSIRLPVIWDIRCWCVKMDLMVGLDSLPGQFYRAYEWSLFFNMAKDRKSNPLLIGSFSVMTAD